MDISTFLPPKLFPQAMPTTSARALATIPAEQVKYARDFPELVQPPENGVGRKRAEGLEIARIIFARHEYIPDHCKEAMFGTLTDSDAIKYWGNSSRSAFATIRKQISNKVYRKDSFLFRLLYGEVSHHDCLVSVTNWALAPLKLEMALPQATEQQRIRYEARAKFTELREATRKLQEDLQQVYRAEADRQLGLAIAPTGAATEADRARDFAEFCLAKAADDSLLEPLIAEDAGFANVAEIRAARLLPLRDCSPICLGSRLT